MKHVHRDAHRCPVTNKTEAVAHYGLSDNFDWRHRMLCYCYTRPSFFRISLIRISVIRTVSPDGRQINSTTRASRTARNARYRPATDARNHRVSSGISEQFRCFVQKHKVSERKIISSMRKQWKHKRKFNLLCHISEIYCLEGLLHFNCITQIYLCFSDFSFIRTGSCSI